MKITVGKNRTVQFAKKAGLMAAGLLVCVGVGLTAAPQANTFSGSIMDSACAATGSHAKMMDSHPGIKSDKACTLGCVKNGAKFVLYDSSTNTVYQLDDQKAPVQYAGDKVKVTGSLNGDTKTIHVEKIEPAA
jgi:hypothetical protein